MIKSLSIANFKGFENYKAEFQRVNLLVGGNNSGKTTVFHALQTVFWCLQQTADASPTEVVFGKTQVADISTIPYFNLRDLFYNQKTRTGNAPNRISLTLETSVAPALTFKLYTAFGRNMLIDGGDAKISRSEFDQLILLMPIYVPGTIGITVREELYRTVAQNRMISEGRQSQVIRNLVYRLKETGEWTAFVDTVRPLFRLEGLSVPFDDAKDEWLTAVYSDRGKSYDFVSAGSGFLQVINLLSFLFLNTSRVALLDEPDSHMHDDLQRVTFDLLNKLSQQRNIQLLIATHSPTMVDAAGLENILVIDRELAAPLRAVDVEELIPILADRGIAPPPAKVMNALKSRTAIFVEGAEDDYYYFLELLGEAVVPGFKSMVRGIVPFSTGGITSKWPFDAIAAFERLLGTNLKYVYVSDRDFYTDDEVAEREAEAKKIGRQISHLSRRNRECYLLEPVVVARVLETKWKRKHGAAPVHHDVTAAGISTLILTIAAELAAEVQTALLVQKEPTLRTDRSARTAEVLKYFNDAYAAPLTSGQVPFKLLDGKLVLRKLRAEISAKHGISWSDRETLLAFHAADVPADIVTILERIRALFPNGAPAAIGPTVATAAPVAPPRAPVPTAAPPKAPVPTAAPPKAPAPIAAPAAPAPTAAPAVPAPPASTVLTAVAVNEAVPLSEVDLAARQGQLPNVK